MKNATKHAEELRSLSKRLQKEYKPAPKLKQEALKALVRGAMSFDVSDSKAEEAMKMIEKEFVDLNELRVATDLEIAELLGVRYPLIEKRVEMITKALNFIFEKEHTLSLDRMATINRKDIRKFLSDLPEIHPFVEAYVMLFAFDAPAVPVDEEMLHYLSGHGILEEGIDVPGAIRFLENHLKGDECYEFFAACRLAAHAEAGDDKKKKRK